MASTSPSPSRSAPSLGPAPLPRHVAIIMDGNGRWARARGFGRSRGHLEGARSVRAVTRECARLGIEALTLYAFSSDNWKRPPGEVNFLMRLLCEYLEGERREILRNGIRLRAIGDLTRFPEPVRRALDSMIEASRHQSGMSLTLALNYGGRDEILRAARRLAERARAGEILPAEIDRRLFSSHLDTADLPDPDLVIRTGGEMRLSGFLLWQIEYAELWVSPKPWPEFREEELRIALSHYAARERRYGGVPPAPVSPLHEN